MSSPKSVYLELATSGNFAGICYGVTRTAEAGKPAEVKHWFSMEDGEPAATMRPRDLVDLVLFLYEQAAAGVRICTWGGLGYDFKLLHAECPAQRETVAVALQHVDPMFNTYSQAGHFVSLEAAASAVPGASLLKLDQIMAGKTVPLAWHANLEGKRAVSKSVQTQARVLQATIQYIDKTGKLLWNTTQGNTGVLLGKLQTTRHLLAHPPGRTMANIKNPAQWLLDLPGFDPKAVEEPSNKPNGKPGTTAAPF